MDKLKELIAICKASVSVTVNQHKDFYQSVESYIDDEIHHNENLINEIGVDVYQEMIKRDVIIEVQAYPDTPIGFYKVYHYNLDKAIELVINYCNEK